MTHVEGANPAQDPPSSGRSRWWRFLLWLAVCGAIGATSAGVMFASWTRLLPTSLIEGTPTAFAERLESLPDQRPYLTFDEEGKLQLDPSLEGEPKQLSGLGLLLWLPATDSVSETRLPWWFIRLKLSSGLNLGSLSAVVSGDWDSLNLPVGPRELERRGPGLVLDERRQDGARILLWTY